MSKQLDTASAAARVVEGMRFDFEELCAQSTAECAPLVDSEIELMLLAVFHMVDRFGLMKVHVGSEFPTEGKRHLLITPQFPWNGFRIDFRFEVFEAPAKPLFVECDGHDFHERTKEQAERDRSKDRAIQAAGIPILRFTGREIWRDPSAVGAEILQFIFASCGKPA